MQMVGITFNTGNYRYGFNGKENDNEVKGVGDQIDYGMRIYDPRVGKFLSVDPISKSYPELTPYQYASNRPIDGVDIDGKEWATEVKIGKTTSGFEIQTSFSVRVKVENASTIIKDPNVIKNKAELYKNSLENRFKAEATFILFGIPFKMIYKTEVILDYSPSTVDDGPIGYLIFDDRKSTTTTVVEHEENNTITKTKTESVPGDTRGQINQFKTSIGITMNGKLVDDADMTSTDEHEGGHSGGLNHPWTLSDDEKVLLPKLDENNPITADVKAIRDNFMNSAENPIDTYRTNGGDGLLLGQLMAMWKKIAEKSHFTPEDLKVNVVDSNSSGNSAPTNDKSKNQ